MAQYPCDVGQHRYPGRQLTIYPAVVNKDYASRRKLRLCPVHFQELVDRLAEKYRSAEIDFLDVEKLACPLCGKPVVDDTAQFFATLFGHDNERADYWAPVHNRCATALADDWLLPPDGLE